MNMWVFWICSGLTLAAGLSATLFSDLRRAVLALWIAGLGVGGIYLSLHAEVLAVIQWIVSTLVAISFGFYGVMFGEYGIDDRRPWKRKLLSFVLPVLLGAAFCFTIWSGTSQYEGVLEQSPSAAQNVFSIGRVLTENYLLPLEVLGLMLFLVIVGSGVIARPDEPESGTGTGDGK
jgi:NADH-quinone oxidoreductase subunit J